MGWIVCSQRRLGLRKPRSGKRRGVGGNLAIRKPFRKHVHQNGVEQVACSKIDMVCSGYAIGDRAAGLKPAAGGHGQPILRQRGYPCAIPQNANADAVGTLGGSLSLKLPVFIIHLHIGEICGFILRIVVHGSCQCDRLGEGKPSRQVISKIKPNTANIRKPRRRKVNTLARICIQGAQRSVFYPVGTIGSERKCVGDGVGRIPPQNKRAVIGDSRQIFHCDNRGNQMLHTRVCHVNLIGKRVANIMMFVGEQFGCGIFGVNSARFPYDIDRDSGVCHSGRNKCIRTCDLAAAAKGVCTVWVAVNVNYVCSDL